jgi:hypothetical protein
MGSISAVSHLSLVQFLVVVIGVLTTCAMLKLNGYGPDTAAHPASGMRRNPVAVAVRSCGLLLLIAPKMWAFGSIALERRAPQFWSRGWMIASGAVLLAVLIGFLAYTTMFPYFQVKIPLQSW